MRIQNNPVPPANPLGRTSTLRRRYTEPRSSIDLLASAFLTLLLIPTFLYLGINLEAALPLAVLTGLISRRLFQLILTPNLSDFFHPTTLVVGYFATYFVFRSLYLDTTPFLHRMGRNAYDDYLTAALWCCCIGYVSFSLGMGSMIAKNWLKRVPARPSSWPRSLPAPRILLMMLVGLVCLLYMFKIGATVGSSSANHEFQRNPPPGVVVLLENLIDMSWVATCIFLVAPERKSSRAVLWLLLGLCLCILLARLAVSGGKEALIRPFLEAAIVFHYGKRRFRIWEIVTVGIPVFMLAFGVVNFYRFVVVAQHGSSKNFADVVSRVSTASDMLMDERGGGTQQSALDQMVDRNAGTDALALIMKYTPHPFPYQYGLHWLEIPLTFVPRQIWRNKPLNLPSAEFEHTYMGEPDTFSGFSSMQFMGDLYRNFAYPGVAGGMFLFGVFLRFLYIFCLPGRDNRTGLFLYATLYPEMIHALEPDVGYALINVIRAALLSIGVALFLGVRFRKSRAVRAAPRARLLARRPAAVGIPPGEVI